MAHFAQKYIIYERDQVMEMLEALEQSITRLSPEDDQQRRVASHLFTVRDTLFAFIHPGTYDLRQMDETIEEFLYDETMEEAQEDSSDEEEDGAESN